jgi:subtilisin family serine protease
MTAGIVAGKPNSQAPGGIAPDANILMANTDFYPQSIVQILDYIYEKREEHNIVALSMSFGVFAINSRADLLSCATNPVYADVRESLEKLRSVGIMPFAASGNGYNLDSAENWAPTCLEEAVSVGSINPDNEVSIYTTISDKVELLAPDYTFSANTYSYRQASGTSAATPLVAGAYALLRQKYPDLTAQQILNAMKNGGNPIDDVIIKQIPALNLKGADFLLEDLSESGVEAPEENPEQKITVGTFNGFIAIFSRGYEGQKLSAKVAGKWLVQDPIENYKSFDYSRVTRNTGAGFDITVELYIDGQFIRTEKVTTR